LPAARLFSTFDRWELSVVGDCDMSEAAAQEGASKGASIGVGPPDRPRRDPSGGPGDGPKRGPWRGILITISGALVTAGIAAAIVLPGAGLAPTSGEEPVLAQLAPAEITAALPTLDPATTKAAVDDAKNCKAPLGSVIVVQRPGGRGGGMVRIRSGAYVSPPIQVTNSPQRVALPYPAPYPTGRGVLSVVGDADEVSIYLTPGWFVPSLKGAASINVHWKVTNPCG
jgi:hypothetical protein